MNPLLMIHPQNFGLTNTDFVIHLFTIHKRRRSLLMLPDVIFHLLSRRQGLLITILALLAICAWSPWLTETYAVSVVTESLGGPDQLYDYLGEMTPISDIPKNAVRVPFGFLVYFPSEAVYIVPFWGWVL